MRTFISLELSENAKNEIVKVQKKLEELNLMKGKFTEKDNLHLTLKFLEEISDDKVEIVMKKLKNLKFGKFEVEFDKLGVFNENFIRIIWLSLKGNGLFKLQKEIDNLLINDFSPEERFMAHITIARPKFVKNKKKFIEELSKIKFEKIKFKVNNIFLKKSTLIRQGPVYEDILVLDAETS